jgi:ABC-2 type transport system ATP-binding protein
MTAAFSIHDLVKNYPDFQLGPLNLELHPGTVLGYVGPNGSGKTTTMHLLAGLIKADGGSAEICGHDQNLRQPVWKVDIGYVGEEQPFYEYWPGEENLEFLSQFYPAWSKQRAADLARRFNLPLNKPVRELSKGNRVKLALVGALAHHPRLLLLDEPTSGLDPVVRAEFLDVLFEYMESGENAIFYSTHVLSDITRLADELAFLENGKIKLRRAKDDLTDQWCRISFQLMENNVRLPAVASHKHVGKDHQVVSFDREMTLRYLGILGAENVEEHRMGIDEIAVQILKGVEHVADPQSRV